MRLDSSASAAAFSVGDGGWTVMGCSGAGLLISLVEGTRRPGEVRIEGCASRLFRVGGRSVWDACYVLMN